MGPSLLLPRLLCRSALVLLGASAATTSTLAQTAQTIAVRIDKNGAAPPAEPMARTLGGLHEGDKLTVQYFPAMVFDLARIDVPRAEASANSSGGATVPGSAPFFVYPQDSYLLFAAPKTLLTNLHPCRMHVYAFGSGRYRLRVTRLTQTELGDSIPVDSPDSWKMFIDRRTNVCYATDDAGLVGLSELADAVNERSTKSRIFGKTEPARRLLRIPDVTLELDERRPFALMEIVQLFPGQFVDAAAQNGCDTRSTNEVRTHARASLARVVAATVVRVARDLEAPELRYGDNIRVDKVSMTASDDAYGAYGATTASLAAGQRQFQVCAPIPADAPIRRFVGPIPERCVPTQAATFAVKAQLPNAIRLQPGVIAVNRWRDVRLIAQAALLVDRPAYFGEKPRTWRTVWGGVFNPAVGLQLGGDNAVVLLMGVHARIIDEAGLVVGFRFGDQSTTSKFQAKRNAYLGFALDPALFTSLKSTK